MTDEELRDLSVGMQRELDDRPWQGALHRQLYLTEKLQQVRDACRPKVPAGAPVDDKRLAEIKRGWGDGGQFWGREVSDLLALVDWLLAQHAEDERWIAMLAQDRECEKGLIEIGVARALAVMESQAGVHASTASAYPPTYGAAKASALRDAAKLIREKCGPARLPPHEERLARYEEALRKIANPKPVNDYWEAAIRSQNLARDALKELK